MGTPYPKEQMHRIAYTKLSEHEILEKLSKAAPAGPESASPLSDVLTGKEIKIVTGSGPTLTYNFASANRLRVSESAIKASLQQLFSKTGVRTRGQLVRIALEQFRRELL